MSTSVKELKEQKEEIQHELDNIKAEVGDGVMSTETMNKWDELQRTKAELNSQIETRQRFLDEEPKDNKAKITKEFSPAQLAGTSNRMFNSRQAQKNDDQNAFKAWIGRQLEQEHDVPTSWEEAACRMSINPARKNLQVSWDQDQDSTTNAAAIPGAQLGGVLKRLVASGGIMSVANVMQTDNANPLRFNLRDTSSYKAVIVAELGDTTATQQTESSVTLGGFSYRSGIFMIPYELIRDAGYNILQDYQDSLVDSFRLGWDEHFAVGDGTGEPDGVQNCTTSVNLDGTGDNVISYLTLVDLFHSVNSLYRASNSCAFAMNDTTLATVRKIVDDNGRPIHNSSYNSNMVVGQEGFLLGKKVVVDDFLDDNNIVFGDFSRYRIRIVGGGVRTQTLNELYSLQGAIGLVGFAAMDAALLDTNAIKKLVSAE